MEVIEFTEVSAENGLKIGFATLTREKSLNSLLLETIDKLAAQLASWQADPGVACIVINSSSDRAFCAGADIQALYHSIIETGGGDNPYAENFFTNEYALDHALHQCTKPVLAWGNGIVMGGGLGLLGGCSHRVGTPESRFAMPEITIGLFPDAGATWFLSRMRSNLGYFMGLTGCQITAGDAFELGVINHLCDHQLKDEIQGGLTGLDWTGDMTANREMLSDYLSGVSLDFTDQKREPLPRNLLRFEADIAALIDRCLAADDFFTTFNEETAALGADDWLQASLANFKSGSPTTAHVFLEQMNRAGGLSLTEMFQMELVIAYQCIRHPDFPEGVRALLIDKDKNPAWKYPDLGGVPSDMVMEHFKPAWQGTHPLAGLTE